MEPFISSGGVEPFEDSGRHGFFLTMEKVSEKQKNKDRIIKIFINFIISFSISSNQI
jgi:hypothetical protein